MRPSPALLLALLLAGPAEATEVKVLSVEGQVRADAGPLESARRLPAASTLTVLAGGRAQLLIASAQGELAVAVLGPARLRLLAKDAEVEVLQGARLRASGSGRLSQQRGPGCYQLTLRDSTAVFDGTRLFLVRGAAQLGYRSGAETQFGPVARQLAPGESVSESSDPIRSAPPAELLTALDHFLAPPWHAAFGRVTLAEVRRAERASNERRRAERETASCGCTESKSTTTAQNPGSVLTATPLERQGAAVRVRVSGVPAVIK
jgi:hypothetical protein